MTTSRLSLYNDALLIVGERPLASLTEEREPRRLLDQAWDSGTVFGCLEMAQWNFAMRAVQLDHDPDYSPEFGYRYRFNKPSDWMVTSALCADEFFYDPITAYADELDFWYADADPIYVRFISNDDSYGLNFGMWPSTFTDYVAAAFAGKIVMKLTSDESRRDYILHPKTGILAHRLTVARSRAAMAKPTKFFPQGNWASARRGRGSRGPMGDGGTSGSLVG